MEEPATLLAELTRALSRNRGSGPIAARLCDALSQVVSADGGAVTMGEAPAGRVVLCATDGPAAEIEDAQEVLRQGPTVDALLTASAVTGLSLAEQRQRWPLLIDLLDSKEAVVSLHAFPVRPDSVVLGAVTRGTAQQITGLQSAMYHRHTIGIAQGILMHRYDIDQDQAFEVLRRYSSLSNTKLRDIAAQVVGHGDLPNDLDWSRTLITDTTVAPADGSAP